MNNKNIIDFLKMDIGYQKWYGDDETSFHFNLNTGLVLGIFFYSILCIYKIYDMLSFNISFYDPSSIFAENLIHLYNIVWIVLFFVIFLILILLIRIIYLFSWNYSYFNSNLYIDFIIITLEYLLVLSFYLNDNKMINQILERLILIENNKSGLNVIGFNLWYNKNGNAFLSISDISEYRYLEIIWCLLPIGSLLLISIPTFSLIFSLDSCIDPVYTIKVIGRQWYWTYELDLFINEKDVDYSENLLKKPIEIEFDSNLVSEDDLIKGTHRLLEVDNRLFLPVGVPLRILITSTDVLHSWAVPSLGIKVDAVPGRLNQFVVEIKRPGIFYGQCSELCGPFHGFMPIVIQAVSINEFEEWMISKNIIS